MSTHYALNPAHSVDLGLLLASPNCSLDLSGKSPTLVSDDGHHVHPQFCGDGFLVGFTKYGHNDPTFLIDLLDTHDVWPTPEHDPQYAGVVADAAEYCGVTIAP